MFLQEINEKYCDELSRRLKPSIPLIGMDQIPIKHELEFEILL